MNFTPKKISIINSYPNSICTDREFNTSIGFEATNIAIPNNINDRVSNNNYYDKNTVSTISTTESGSIVLPKSQLVCPKVDLAVVAVGQNFS